MLTATGCPPGIELRPSSTLIVPRASDVGGCRPVPALKIATGDAVDEMTMQHCTTASLRDYYDRHAGEIVEAMIRSLPVALTDRILAQLLGYKASTQPYAEFTGN